RGEERVRVAVDGAERYHLVAGPQVAEEHCSDGADARAESHGGLAVLERGHLLLDCPHRRVARAAVSITRRSSLCQARPVLDALQLVSTGLEDGRGVRASHGIGLL